MNARAVSAAGFTLIELMVVLVIVGILAGITIPAFNKIVSIGKVKVAHSDALQLKNAIASYATEYGRVPLRNPDPDDGDQPLFSGRALMDVLLASDPERKPGGLNPRGVVFCSYNNARPMGDGKFRSGLVMANDGGGELFDPYGNLFRIVMDTDHDNRIPAPAFDLGSRYINQKVIVWSAGKDGDDETARDNIMTWRP